MLHKLPIKLPLQLTFLSLIIACALGINYLAAWTGPTATAPSGNVDAPLNIGTTNQVKDANLSVGHSANTASDFGLISYGKIRSTIGGVQFPDGTVQTTAGGGGALKAVRSYTSSGTWTKPSDLSYVVVEVWGGGGGGQSYGRTNGTSGGASSFGSHVSATGGGNNTSLYVGGAGGIGSGGNINLRGGTGAGMPGSDGGLWGAGGYGGAAARGGAGGIPGFGYGASGNGQPGVVPGGGGGGAGHYHGSGGGTGGGGGGYAMEMVTASSLGTSETITIGSGGIGGTNAYGNGGAGSAGMVVVYEY